MLYFYGGVGPLVKGDSSQPASIGDDYTVKENSGGGGGGGGGRGYYYVRTFAWTPDYGQQEVVLESCKGVEAGECKVTSVSVSMKRQDGDDDRRSGGAGYRRCHSNIVH